MGTTRIKVIDLSSQQQEIKTSRKHAQKLAGAQNLKKDKRDKKPATTEIAEKKLPIAVDMQTEIKSEDTPSIEEPQESKSEDANEKTVSGNVKKSVSSVVARKQSNKHKGKKYQAAKKLVEDKVYSAKEAFEILTKTSTTKFDPSVEIHLAVADKNTKGNINFPHAFSTKQKETRYLVFCEKQPAIEGKQIIWANEKTVDEIEGGNLKPKKDFDVVITTPKFMPSLAKVAKILGPVGLMPNPKNGTITEDIQKAVSPTNQGFQYKTDPTSPVVHIKIGKLSQKSSDLEENLKTLVLAIGPSKIKRSVLTTTMGPGIRLDISTL